MNVKGEPDETVTDENFNEVRDYLFAAIDKGRMNFSGWPLENLRAIPESPDADGTATEQLRVWVERHMLRKTRATMFSDLREAQFEAAKRAAEVILSLETRNALKEYRDRLFGEGQGSMELAVKHLLDISGRALPRDAFQLLEAFRQRKGLKTPGDAIRALIDLEEQRPAPAAAPPSPTPSPPPPRNDSPPDDAFLQREVKQLLRELKENAITTPMPST